MIFTKFKELEKIIAGLGASPVVAKLNKALTGQGISIESNTDHIVVGKGGIYYIDPQGVLTKVVVHIVDMNVGSWYANELKASIYNEDFESSLVLKKIHKYHLLKCPTIASAEKEKWQNEKYKMSRRTNGSFFYRFVEGQKILFERKEQKLFVCKNCLRKLSDMTRQKYNRRKFSLEEFLFSEFGYILNLEKKGKYAEEGAANIYPEDWAKISSKYRGLRNYQCEEEDCPDQDLSGSEFREYLHSHHISYDKSDSNYSNLKALCIYCHARQPGHDHVKQLPGYKKYLKLRNLD